MRYYKLICCFLLCCNTLIVEVRSQQFNLKSFRSINQFAMLNGNDAVGAGLQSVNGIAYKNWFAATGVGIDFYRYRSVPIFVDLRRDFKLKKGRTFAYADLGYNLPWAKDEEDKVNVWPGGSFKRNSYFKGGLYSDVGLGYAADIRSGDAILISVGYSTKTFKKTVVTSQTVRGGNGQPDIETNDITKFNHYFNRLSIKIGWQF